MDPPIDDDRAGGVTALERAITARALETVAHVIAMLRAKGWDFVLVSVATRAPLGDGTCAFPGASSFDVQFETTPALACEAEHLRAIAADMDARCREIGDGRRPGVGRTAIVGSGTSEAERDSLLEAMRASLDKERPS